MYGNRYIFFLKKTLMGLTMKSILVLIPILFILSCSAAPDYDELLVIAKSRRINGEASIKAEASIMLQVPSYIVWKRVGEIKIWPKWSSVVSETTIRGKLDPGRKFTWKANEEEFNSEIAVYEPINNLSIISKGPWGISILLWNVSAISKNTTVLLVKESIDGFWVNWIYSPEERKEYLEKWLKDLKQSLTDGQIIDAG